MKCVLWHLKPTSSSSWLCSNAGVWLSVVHADYVKGFGGKFGVQTDRQDKCALGWDHQEKLQLHESQKGTSSSPLPAFLRALWEARVRSSGVHMLHVSRVSV